LEGKKRVGGERSSREREREVRSIGENNGIRVNGYTSFLKVTVKFTTMLILPKKDL
jgi:hypothetical protein